MVKLGETLEDGLFCDYRNVYASFEFSLAQSNSEPSPPDPLTVISEKRIGHCL